MSLSALRDKAVIMALGLVAGGFFAIISSPLSGFDPVQYDRLGLNMASGHGFSLSEKEPYLPTMFREPGYPSFLAIIYRIFGHNIVPVVLIQILLHALTALIAYKIAENIFSRKTAFLSGILVAAFPTLVNSSSYLMSETLFTFLLCASTYIFMRAVESEKLFLFTASGVLFGILVLTKLTSLFLPFIVAVVAILTVRTKRVKKLFFGAVIMLLISSLMVSVWSLRNKMLFNTFSPAIRGGDVMWSRAQKIDDSPREILATAACSFSEYAGKKMFPDLVVNSDRYLYKDLDKAVELQEKYKREGHTIPEVDNILKKEAFAKISRYPFKYASYTFVEAIKMTAFTYLPFFNEPPVRAYFKGLKNGDLIFSVLKSAMRMMAYPLLILSIAGALRNLNIWHRWIVIFIVILYFNAAYSLMDAIGRYGVPLIPFYCIFAATAFCSVREESK